ncbi:ion channel [Oscillatoria salina]|uniref:ion channel n=1 Tax=Oscillatoria salina TaxID=331517 RepID=UPI0013B5F284|nr:ion channel [Oscillatoria salina]MBZ8181444.1 ATP-sensitive inward rectifier potassium channel 10 [Oscillatoria salina IIICB1]NET88400.1 ATP-sensitive inward rectifier potassium channel 10 [Kamptonema sp. SIO1D9]
MSSQRRPRKSMGLGSSKLKQYRIPTSQPFQFNWNDLYHRLLIVSWFQFFALIVFSYLIINLCFAFAYLLQENSITNAQPGSLIDAFFFSVQTMSTIGYGAMSPQTWYANFLVTIEALFGLLGVAMATGLMFARFSRPTARVIFSRVAVICPFNGVPTLMFRTANQRDNRILEGQIRVSLLRNEVSPEGIQLRRFYDLQLLRSQTPIFGLTWMVMHPIDENSPLFQVTTDLLIDWDAEILVTLTGLDETFSQTIHARYSYRVEDIFWNLRFVDIFSRTTDGKDYKLDLTHFNEVIPLPSEGKNKL